MRALAVLNGRITTLDPAQPEVAALLAVDGRVELRSSTAEVRDAAQRLPADVTLDLAGRRAVPGFVDSHIHFVNYGLNLERVELTAVLSLEEVCRRVAEAARQTPAGEWVRGWGWDHSLWPDPRFPDRTSLDAVTGNVPAALRRKDGHMVWLNSAALRAAGITLQTEDPPGGRIGRDAHGEPDGLLFENAQDLVYRVMPEVTPVQAERAAERAQAALHKLGVTGIHVPEAAYAFTAFQALDARDALRLRVAMMLTHDGLDAAIETGMRSGFGGRFLRVGPMKMFVDGSLGSETAAMLAPFEGSDNTGILTVPEAEIARGIERAAHAGIASAIHAIGDRANRVVLDAFEQTRAVWQPLDLRQRIEHAQVLHPDDVPRFAALGVIPSMQPIHATQDMDLVDKLWGERGRYAYAFGSLHDSGAQLAFGSDAPVETPDPLAGLYAAVARRRPDGRPAEGWYPQERLPIERALAAYTTGAAYAVGMERELGRLAPGYYADLTVLSEDILRGEPETILAARVVATVLDGEVVYAT